MTGGKLRTSDFDYDLPPEAIAGYPGERGESRLLVLGRTTGKRRFADLPKLLDPGDLLVVNDTRVIPARLRARRPTGGRVEILLVEREGPASWWCLLRPGRRLPPGAPLAIEGGPSATVDERADGRFRLTFEQPIEPLLAEIGETPLPPYIDRPVEPRDRERYQTIYAARPGAVAAPTAGLHFTPALLGALERRGVRRASLTLHVGPGTFRPVKTENPEAHVMESERFEIPEATAEAVAAARRSGRRVVAVGTTVVRSLETAASTDGLVAAGAGRTGLYIRPGYEFRVVDRLITNFHLPRSTLLMLVCAFAGRRRTLDAYRQAIGSGFRFYSYGDAMLVDRMR
ncbi:MAG: tRNA preQ1(34) S-adenosylmethionine ribosyltransferase-isomerase QueA [Acidobacteriota bacterium]|nr:tRNA preQ1(34) S-adenosylmethionine ribosyltransferase-isomerase QueA [Acidobacteriota bacterium]